MEAIKAREISETGENSLKDLLHSIKANAEVGMITAVFSKKDRVIRDVEVNKLRSLGYKIIKENDDYLTISW